MESDVRKMIQMKLRDGVSINHPIVGRKYTMTHSDETAMRFVSIGTEYAEDEIGPMRDEVLLEIIPIYGRLHFYGSVLVDSPNSEESLSAKRRNEIFLREMPKALEAIRYADRELFEYAPILDELPVYIRFQSEDKELDKIYKYGKMKDYRID